MRLLFVRHGEPYYPSDSLTERGWKEVEALVDRLQSLNIKEYFVSPLGRAIDTATPTLHNMNIYPTVLPWLQEFPAKINRPDTDDPFCCWDWLPSDWMKYPEFYDADNWYNHPIMKEGKVKEEFDKVTLGIDTFLQQHGYLHKDKYFEVINSNKDTYCFICHFGITALILSYLFNISPMILWHHFVMSPSSITSIYTEERKEGIASFRCDMFGDVSHLYQNKLEPSPAARFREIYQDEDYIKPLF